MQGSIDRSGRELRGRNRVGAIRKCKLWHPRNGGVSARKDNDQSRTNLKRQAQTLKKEGDAGKVF